MLKINTPDTIKTILLSLLIVCSASLFAQSEKTSDESVIVMTKSELNSFLSTIADARRSQLQERESKERKLYLAELRLKYQGPSRMESGSSNTISNQQILREIQYLNQRIDNLSGYNNASPSMRRDNSTIILPSNTSPNQSYPLSGRNSTTVIPSNNKKMKELQDQLDSLKLDEAIRANMGKEKSFADSLDMMTDRIKNVRREMDSLERKIMNTEKMAVTEDTSEDKTFFKQQVYFEHNSETLNTKYFQYIEYMTQILIKYPEAKILLEGWASPVGKPSYNKQLSMRRAEAVAKAFIRDRIDASRIISSFKGEDHLSSEEHSRRVDMSIIVK